MSNLRRGTGIRNSEHEFLVQAAPCGGGCLCIEINLPTMEYQLIPTLAGLLCQPILEALLFINEKGSRLNSPLFFPFNQLTGLKPVEGYT